MAELFASISAKMKDTGYKPTSQQKAVILPLTPTDLFGMDSNKRA